jgi:DNA polymerase (family X)
MTNREIVTLLKRVSEVYDYIGADRFRIAAYQKAADSIQSLTDELSDLWKAGKLESVSGIGKTLASHLDELFRTGTVRHFEEVFSKVPEGVFPLTDIPGIGVRKAVKLVTALSIVGKVNVVAKLKKAAEEGKIAVIDGFGEKSQSDILDAIHRYSHGEVKDNRMPLPYAGAIASEVIEYLKLHQSVINAVTLGSLRRGVETIGDIDIAVTTKSPDDVVSYFLAYPKVKNVVERGKQGATVMLTNGRQIDLRVTDPSKFGAMLQYFTGSKAHNIKLREYALKRGLSLNEYGIKQSNKTPIGTAQDRQISNLKSQNYNSKLKIYEFTNEESFYSALGLPFIEPELREDRGEIQASIEKTLPRLVSLNDVKGDFHIHSDYDVETSHDRGVSTIGELIAEAVRLNYEFIGISDHNPSQSKHNNNDITSILKRRRSHFESYLSSHKSVRIQLLIMIECDILPDGNLPIPESAMEYLDGMIVSVHSTFGLTKTMMTQRILRGLAHPKAKILGHPTGRLLMKRPGYDADWDAIFSYLAKTGKAVEVNCCPERLDLPDSLVRKALKYGVKIALGSDSHDVSGMKYMPYGVLVSRRGWTTPRDVLNALSIDRLVQWMKYS